MDWSLRVCVWLVPTAVVDLVVVDWPEPLVGVFMRPQLQVNSILVEQILKPKPATKKVSHSRHTFQKTPSLSLVI